ncbi:GtrA family protein [Acinetobacter faecalis]|uniref:GtrA family protein n=1 Tax=Acinetobacter faecalis TaxID=2665161 RepID=UPI002A91AEEB|nr:GtrA family protein [Acinetobacter faecalis]MDY6484290.1 GtrA family protein [Acinetobacter faecalis]
MINHEVVKFLVVGSSTVIIDYICYIFIVEHEITSINLAKAISFLIGTLFAYMANRFWTFKNNSNTISSLSRFSLLYTCTFLTNILINAFSLKILSNIAIATQLAFLIATGVTACLNFIGMKFFVFKSTQTSEF